MPCAIEMPLSPKLAAELTGCGLHEIYAAIKAGTLRARRKRGQSSRWWILRSDLEAWAAGGMFGEEQR